MKSFQQFASYPEYDCDEYIGVGSTYIVTLNGFFIFPEQFLYLILYAKDYQSAKQVC